MKSNIHPEYKPTAIRCACGNVIETRSTYKGDVQVEICSACHPFYTGQNKLMDTAGRIDRFKKKFGEKMNVAIPKKVKPVRAEKPVTKLGESAAKSGGKKEEKETKE